MLELYSKKQGLEKAGFFNIEISLKLNIDYMQLTMWYRYYISYKKWVPHILQAELIQSASLLQEKPLLLSGEVGQNSRWTNSHQISFQKMLKTKFLHIVFGYWLMNSWFECTIMTFGLLFHLYIYFNAVYHGCLNFNLSWTFYR